MKKHPKPEKPETDKQPIIPKKPLDPNHDESVDPESMEEQPDHTRYLPET